MVKDLSCKIDVGEVWIIRGPNGSGKSTLIKTIIGLLPAVAGRIKRGPALDGLRNVGFVPQQARVAPSLAMTVREFVELGTVGWGCSGSNRGEAVAETLAAVGLGEEIGQDVRRLSGGQLRRAAIARALVRQPLLMILDEPMAGLDPEAEAGVLNLLQRLQRKSNMAILMVSHDPRHAAAIGHYGIVLNKAQATIERIVNKGDDA